MAVYGLFYALTAPCSNLSSGTVNPSVRGRASGFSIHKSVTMLLASLITGESGEHYGAALPLGCRWAGAGVRVLLLASPHPERWRHGRPRPCSMMR